MVEVCSEDDVTCLFVDHSGVRIIEDDFTAVLDKSTTAKQRMWHMVENGNTGGCVREVVEGDCSGFDLMHAVTIGDTDTDSIFDRFPVSNAGLLSGIVIAGCRIKFPGGRGIASVVGKHVVTIWTGNWL